MRLLFPKDENSDASAKEKAQLFLKNVLAKADIVSASGKGLISFSQLPVLTPRGRYDIEMFPSFMRMHGKTFDYKHLPLRSFICTPKLSAIILKLRENQTYYEGRNL
jgi:hypothetical protein